MDYGDIYAYVLFRHRTCAGDVILVRSKDNQSNLLCNSTEQEYTKQENVCHNFDHLHAPLLMDIFGFSFSSDDLAYIPKSATGIVFVKETSQY